MSAISLTISITPEVDNLLIQAKQLQAKISEKQSFISMEQKSDKILCPVCQDGYLCMIERGKSFKFFSDIWLICNNCNAEFDKKLGKATLTKATEDPYGIFTKYAKKTFLVEEWKRIALQRIKEEIIEFEEQLYAIQDKIAEYLVNQFIEGKINFTPIDINSFILKKDETPFFGTIAEIIEERKRRVTQKTTMGGDKRRYAGFSFRVVKGVYYHTGSSSYTTPRHTIIRSSEYTELVAVDYGDFIITNQRVMFRGNRSRGFAIPIKKIAAIDIDQDENALLIVQENKKPVILKIHNSFDVIIAGVQIPFSIDLDNLVRIVKRAAI